MKTPIYDEKLLCENYRILTPSRKTQIQRHCRDNDISMNAFLREAIEAHAKRKKVW